MNISPQEAKQIAEEAYLYAGEAVLDGSWLPPSIKRLD